MIHSLSCLIYDVTAAILVLPNNEMAAILVYQTNPAGVQLLSYVKKFLTAVPINLHVN